MFGRYHIIFRQSYILCGYHTEPQTTIEDVRECCLTDIGLEITSP